MENTIDTVKNVTLSFKTTVDEKTDLQQIANEKQISRSELIASLVHAFKYNYDHIGKASPKEEELRLQLEIVTKQNRKLALELENAEHKIEMQEKTNQKYVKGQLVMNKTIFDLQEKLKTANTEIINLNELLESTQALGTNNNNPLTLWSSMGSLLLSGLALLFAPRLFNS